MTTPLSIYKNSEHYLTLLEKFVYDNEESFMQEFAPYADTLLGLNGIYFSSEHIKFYYILSCGQHIVDGITREKFLGWASKHNNYKFESK